MTNRKKTRLNWYQASLKISVKALNFILYDRLINTLTLAVIVWALISIVTGTEPFRMGDSGL